MPSDSTAAKAANLKGWTIPQDYQPVHELMKELRLGPYKDYGKLTFRGMLERYWYLLVAILVIMFLTSFFAGHVSRINRRLSQAKAELERAHDNLEMQVKERTSELSDANQSLENEIANRKLIQAEHEKLIAQLQDALAKIKTLRGMVPICSNCKKVRNDKGFWEQVEAYVSEHTEAEFSHGMCPDCIKKLYPEYYGKKSEGS